LSRLPARRASDRWARVPWSPVTYLRTWSRWEIRPKSYDRSDHLPHTRRSAPRCGATGEPGQGPGRTFVSGPGSTFQEVTAGIEVAAGEPGARQLGVTAPEQVVRWACQARSTPSRSTISMLMSGSAVSSRYRKNHRTSTLVEVKSWGGPQQQEPVHTATHRPHPWSTAPGTHFNPQSPDTEQSKTNGEERVTSTETEKTQQQPHLTYRNDQPSDVSEHGALDKSCYRGATSRNDGTTEADLLGGGRIDQPSMFALQKNPATTILIAEIDNSLVACCELQRSVNGTYFGMFSVRPTIQGIGLGRRVLAQAEHTAVQLWGSRLMRMKVLKQRPELIAWYERRG